MKDVIISFVSFVPGFLLLRTFQCWKKRDMFWKYILIDSVYFGIVYSFLFGAGERLNVPNQVGIMMEYFFIYGPFLYLFLKRYYLSLSHPNLFTEYYLVWEILILEFSAFIGIFLYSTLSDIFYCF